MTDSQIRALRGAITVQRDDAVFIRDATQELLREILAANGLERQDVVSAVFTMTSDLSTESPGNGARLMGWNDVPIMCAQEAHIDRALPRCIRVMLHARTQQPARHVYLRDAITLRPDLATD